MKIILGGKEYELSTSLRVVYALRDISHAKNLQEAIASISQLDLDGQLDLLYAAYKAANRTSNTIGKTEFTDLILDNFGILAITDKINQLADGLLYSGLTPEEVATKKTQVEVQVARATATGAVSSAEDIN